MINELGETDIFKCGKENADVKEIELKLIFGKPVPSNVPESFKTITLYKEVENGQEEFLGKVKAPRDHCLEIIFGGEDRFYLRTKHAGFAIIYNESSKGLYRFDSVCTAKLADLHDEDCDITNKSKVTVKKIKC